VEEGETMSDTMTRPLNASIWERHPEDWYVEQEWVSARLFEQEHFAGDVVDPACGMGRIAWAAAQAGLNTVGADLVDRSPSAYARPVGLCPTFHVDDFLSENWGSPHWWARPTNIVSNPPFKHAEAFVTKALQVASGKVAMLLPSKWMHGDKRSRWLEQTPLLKVLHITPRPSMPPGPVIEAGVAPGGGKEDFAWFIWLQGYDGNARAGWLRRDG
jgi:hypothetical protein